MDYKKYQNLTRNFLRFMIMFISSRELFYVARDSISLEAKSKDSNSIHIEWDWS